MYDNGLLFHNRDLNRYQLAKLHTFTVVARYQSFALAAQELNLTPSAVSHQINKLENELGFKLFKRFHRYIELTEEGKKLSSTLHTLLYQLNQDVIDIKNKEVSGQIDIYCRPSIAQCWLVPRLHRFTQQYPFIKLNLLTGNEIIDFNRHKVDLAIYYDDVYHKELFYCELMSETITPVCSPSYAEKHQLHNKLEHLKYCTFLHDSQAWEYNSLFSEWEFWAKQMQLQYEFSQLKYILFDRSDLAIMAAVNGMGVALGRSKLIRSQLESGKLVVPFPEFSVPCNARYYVITPFIQKPKIHSFIEWLKTEV